MILVAVAGGVGAATRLVVDGVISSRTSGRLPWGTALINVTGSFLLGLVVAIDPRGAAILGTGFLGGFTTFSTASLETARLVLDGQRWSAAGYGFGVLVLAVGAASAGYAIGRL
jgi:CrcB protein